MIAIVMLLAGVVTVDVAKAQQPAEVQVPLVVGLRVEILKSNPPTIHVKATGEVPTTGWANARLAMRPPGIVPNGLMEFDMYATPPSGISQPTVSYVTAEAYVPENTNYPTSRVRVYGLSLIHI